VGLSARYYGKLEHVGRKKKISVGQSEERKKHSEIQDFGQNRPDQRIAVFLALSHTSSNFLVFGDHFRLKSIKKIGWWEGRVVMF
jgi:hypothetical protein